MTLEEKIQEKLKGLKDFEVVLEDGLLKDCLVYHECIEIFFREALQFIAQSAKEEERKRILDELQAECDRTENEDGRLLVEWFKSKT